MNLLVLVTATALLQITTFGFSFRLPVTTKPLYYSLKIRSNFSENHFSGVAVIDVNLERESNSIVLHSANLTIDEVILDQNPVIFALKSNLETLEIFQKDHSEISNGAHRIRIKYKGGFDNYRQLGLSKTGFRKNQTLNNPLIISDLEPTAARTFYPCFDEPSLKSRFRLTVAIAGYEEDYFVLSNTNIRAKFNTSEGVIYKFKPTPVMSTYLLTIAITNFKYLEEIATVRNKQIPIRIYSCEFNNSSRIIEFAKKALEFFTDYLDFEYPLEKIDLIEYERNFTTATENWGLVTFAQDNLQFGYGEEHDQAETIAHEFAHFWFGNLVTNFWWDDIWLQEGFAQYLSVKVLPHIFNKTYVDDHYSLRAFPAFDLDLGATGPVVKPVERFSEILGHFSHITYVKGGEILRMVEDIIGEDSFRTVLREYIKKFAFKTATTSDLLEIIEKHDDTHNLREFIESFLYQNRFPIVSVEETEDSYVLTQMACVFKNKTKNEDFFEHKWTIPLKFVTNLKPSEPKLVWFFKDIDKLTIPKLNASWIKLNYGSVGYYFVKYPDKLQKTLIECRDLNVYEKDHLRNEAEELFHQDLLPCEYVFKYILDNIRKSPRGVFEKIISMFYRLRMKGAKSDSEAYQILVGFYQWVRNNDKLERISEKYIRSSSTPKTRELTSQVPEYVEKCLQWIKADLEMLINNIDK